MTFIEAEHQTIYLLPPILERLVARETFGPLCCGDRGQIGFERDMQDELSLSEELAAR